MPAFEYQALDEKGRKRGGVIQGDTAKTARQSLRDRGLMPMSVTEVRGAKAVVGDGGRTGHRVAPAELMLALRQLATMARAGLTVEKALSAAARQAEKQRMKRVLAGVHAGVVEGESLADAMARFPQVFDGMFTATVAAGERSGHLAVVLERLADFAERRQRIRSRVVLALIYPTVLTVVAVAVIAGLMGYVVPQVVQVFEGLNEQLPWLTRWLITLSDATRQYGVALSLVLVTCAIGLRLSWGTPVVRKLIGTWALKTPLVQRLVRGWNAARFTATLGIMTASAVPILEALRIAAGVIGNLPMRVAVDKAVQRVAQGEAISMALSESGYFPPVTLQLMASGESSGELEKMLHQAAENLDQELEALVATLLALFEPLLILVMGGIVLIIVLAILLPVFELNRLVN